MYNIKTDRMAEQIPASDMHNSFFTDNMQLEPFAPRPMSKEKEEAEKLWIL